jgi:hypothetical protein
MYGGEHQEHCEEIVNTIVNNTLEHFMSANYDSKNPKIEEAALINTIFYNIENFRMPLFDYNPTTNTFNIGFYKTEGDLDAPHISLIIDSVSVKVIPSKVGAEDGDLKYLKKIESENKNDLIKIVDYAKNEYNKINKNFSCGYPTIGGRRSRRKSHKNRKSRKNRKSHRSNKKSSTRRR